MKKSKIYLSSTFKDLKDFRALVRLLFENQLNESFEHCKIMERMWDDGSQTPFIEECIREVRLSDIYIIILGNKVGSFPPNEIRTYTEIELDTAIAENKKIFFFRFKDFISSEIDNPQKHKELLNKFEGKPTHFFQNEVELKSELLECLIPHINKKELRDVNSVLNLYFNKLSSIYGIFFVVIIFIIISFTYKWYYDSDFIRIGSDLSQTQMLELVVNKIDRLA